ncbi:ABC transporter ATP-binding protein [Promicromonospora sp. MS192]|uniref:ABC transporter ATP-binding protein n=1 Tax=Promicromonospora sp. MS192 TaxID=3412684 RepID=UPI003C2F3C40
MTKHHGAGTARVLGLWEVSVEFAPATFTAIMGPSGSGKTTLMHCAAGLDEPDEGSVVLAGHDVAGLGDRARSRLRREQVAFVFQDYNLVPTLPVWMNVALPRLVGGRRADRRAVAAALDRVGLSGVEHRLPGALSGGQQQRVAMARAVALRPRVLFADEPTGALDTGSRAQVLDLLRGLVDEAGTTVVMVTHDPVAAAAADRVVYLRDGRIVGESASRDAVELGGRLARLGQAA